MNLKLYQIFFNDSAELDPGCIPYSTVGIDPKPYYENRQVFDIASSENWEGIDYWGVTSWRMKEKTGLTKADLDKAIADNPGYDAYIYSDLDPQYAVLHNKQHPVGIVWARLFEKGIFERALQSQMWIGAMFNYWVARPDVVKRYKTYLSHAMYELEMDPIASWIANKISFPHRKEMYSLHTFVLEYLFGLFLVDNPDIKYFVIKNKKS